MLHLINTDDPCMSREKQVMWWISRCIAAEHKAIIVFWTEEMETPTNWLCISLLTTIPSNITVSATSPQGFPNHFGSCSTAVSKRSLKGSVFINKLTLFLDVTKQGILGIWYLKLFVPLQYPKPHSFVYWTGWKSQVAMKSKDRNKVSVWKCLTGKIATKTDRPNREKSFYL